MSTLKEIEFKGKLAALMIEYEVVLEQDCLEDSCIYTFSGPDIAIEVDDLYKEFNA